MKKEKSQTIKTIKKVVPSVVSIAILKRAEELEKELKKESNKKGKEIKIPEEKINAQGMVQVDGGSGFIVDKTGLILTNKHVVSERNAEYRVITNNEKKYTAEILARDPVNDIAILKIQTEENFLEAKLGDSEKLELGQSVLAFGNALGLFKNTISSGIISGLSRSITAPQEKSVPPQEMRGLIQTDAAINPGNSGGPLTNIFGEVIGINAATISGAENISFAIPINSAKRDLDDLKKFGKIRRPLLGFRYLLFNQDMSEELNLPVDQGALVTGEHLYDPSVIAGTPAEKAGLKDGDILMEWNGERITPEKGIMDYLERSEIGETITLTLLRGGKETKKKLTLEEKK